MQIVAVTACPTGIAHSQMGAEALERAATEAGHDIHVEVEGAMGTENELTRSQIESADVALVAADVRVDVDRFADLPTVKASVSEAVTDPAALVERAVRHVSGDETTGASDTAPPAESDASPPAASDDERDGLLARLAGLFR
jgi:PTS system fructose-specific IIB component